MVDVPGVGRLIDPYKAEPAELRWLSIHPDGRVVERRSANLIGWSVSYDMWVQFRLLRDVCLVVAPSVRGVGVPVVVTCTDALGSVLVARNMAGLRPNPVGAALLAAVGAVCEVAGTAAWLGAQDPQTGLHADLERVNELRALAAHCRTG